jgi:MraZ protein
MGTFRHAIDDKGRLTLPGRIRDALAPEFVATKGLERCIYLYPASQWEALAAKLLALPQMESDIRFFVRMSFGASSDCRVDGQGRVLLPPELRGYGGLDREAVIVGVGNRAEVWQPDAWARCEQEAEPRMGDIAQRLASMGL